MLGMSASQMLKGVALTLMKPRRRLSLFLYYLFAVISLPLTYFLLVPAMWGLFGPHGGGPTPIGVLFAVVFLVPTVAVGWLGYKAGRRAGKDPALSNPWTNLMVGAVSGICVVVLAVSVMEASGIDITEHYRIAATRVGLALLLAIILGYGFWLVSKER